MRTTDAEGHDCVFEAGIELPQTKSQDVSDVSPYSYPKDPPHQVPDDEGPLDTQHNN